MIATPGVLIGTPEFGRVRLGPRERGRMDVLSDVLRVVRLTSAVFFTARFSSPWSIESPPPDQLARSLRLRAESIALFHVLVEGQCWISTEGHAPLKME